MADTDKGDGDLLGDLGKAFDDLHEEGQQGLDDVQQELREAMRPPTDAPEHLEARASKTRKPPMTGAALAAHRQQRANDGYDPTLEHEFETDAADLQRYEGAAELVPGRNRENIVVSSGAQGILDTYRRLGKRARTDPGRPVKMRQPRGRSPELKKQLGKLQQAFDEGYNEPEN